MKELIINGIDCTKLATRYGLTVRYKKIHGKAGGTMLDGSTTEDVLAIKAVLSFDFIPQSEEVMGAFLKRLHSSKYATVKYFDIEENDYREIEAIYGEVEVRYIFENIEGFSMWRANTLTFTER